MIKLKHKPSGRYLTISEDHALSLLKNGKEYIEVPIEEGRPEVKVKEVKVETKPETIAESEIEAPVKVVSKKKAKKKSSKKS